MSIVLGLTIEVERWLDDQGRRRRPRERNAAFYKRTAYYMDYLKLRRGVPDGDHLRILSPPSLCEVWFYVYDECWSISYYVAPVSRPNLLTVSRCDGGQPEIQRALRAMERCIAGGHDVDIV